jgi:hypothetical protein
VPFGSATGSTRKANSRKEEFYRFPSRTGSHLIQDTEDEESVLAQAPRAKKRKANGLASAQSELAEELRTVTAADVWAEMLRQTEVLLMVADTSGNPKGTYVKALRHAANVGATGIREMTRRTDTTTCASAITEARLAALEAERATPPAWETSVQSRFTAIERKIEKLGTVLARLTDNLSESTKRKKGKEVVPEKTASRVDTGGPNTPAITSGQAAVMEWQTVERKKKAKKKASAEKQPTKTTPRSGSKNPSKAPERGAGTAGKRRDKPPLPRTPRT